MTRTSDEIRAVESEEPMNPTRELEWWEIKDSCGYQLHPPPEWERSEEEMARKAGAFEQPDRPLQSGAVYGVDGRRNPEGRLTDHSNRPKHAIGETMTDPEKDALKAVAKAARRYFVGYVQDEAEDMECCLSEDQHEDAKALEKALSHLESYFPGN